MESWKIRESRLLPPVHFASYLCQIICSRPTSRESLYTKGHRRSQMEFDVLLAFVDVNDMFGHRLALQSHQFMEGVIWP